MQADKLMTRQRTDFRKVSLRKIPLFQTSSNHTIKKIEENSKRVNYSRGGEIVSRFDDSDEVFVLLSGMARVIVFSAGGKAVGFRRINPGDFFGEFAAIDGQRRSATVEAVKPSAVLSVTSEVFWEIMESDRAFLAVVLNHLVDLLRSATARIVEFSTLAVKNRIHCELLRMAKGAAVYGSGECLINPAPTHAEIAARISTHREAVSREFSQMKRVGLIERRGRILVVKDMARLEQMVHDASGDELADGALGV
jgi:CRP/FNR family cyclic AMP-dependent transcriptional regulator